MKVKKFSTSYQAQLYKKQASPSFCGLTSKLSKAVYEKDEAVELFKKFESKSHGIIGKLPAQWIYAIPFEKRQQIIKNIFANFGEEFAKLRNKKPDADSFARITASRQITKLLKQSGVLKGLQRAKVSYVDSGSFADVYRLDVKGESYAVKVFKKVLELGFHFDNINGNFFEQPVAQYMKGKIPKRKNNWFKFYFGDLKNGIMVSRFENGDYPFDGKPFATEKIGILVHSREHYNERNCLEGRILDVGSVEVLEHAKNKTMRYVYSKAYCDQLAPLKILEETLKWKPSAFYNDRLKGVFYSFQMLSNENTKKCLDKLLPAADDEVALFMADNIYYSAYSLRKGIFDSLYARNNPKIDLILAKKLENIQCPITPDSECVKMLLQRDNPEINKLIKELFL